ncbi:MAG: magnesium transporter CorA family protein [Clostridium perfringens]|nr:magnesium transporter CorA family protein [Clostridium perfringens]
MVIFNIDNEFKIENNWAENTFKCWIVAESHEMKKISYLFNKECIDECLDYNQEQRIDYYNEYIFILIGILEQENNEIKSKEMDIFLGKDFIITVYKSPIKLLEELIGDIKENKNCHLLKEIKNPSIILYYILDRIIVKNYNIISELETKGDKIELDILKEPHKEQLNALLFVRREAYKLRKLLKPLRYIGDTLSLNENGIINDEAVVFFKAISRKLEKLMIALDNLSQELALVREAYESEIANKTNELMKVFTIITAIFLPLELVTALFSMSFDYMPFKEYVLGFYGVIIFLILVTFILLVIFKHKRIL